MRICMNLFELMQLTVEEIKLQTNWWRLTDQKIFLYKDRATRRNIDDEVKRRMVVLSV